MLVVENNQIEVNWYKGDRVNPIQYGGDLVIVIDPGKTNMAVVIGTPQRLILNCLEFSGNNRGRGPVMDTTEYMAEVREFLREYLKNANLYMVAIEEAVTYKSGKDGKKDTPYNYHQSNLALTEVRSAILNLFLEEFQIHVLEVNNWSWKSHTLPKGYRSQSEKGSKRFFTELLPDSPYGKYFHADITDCICIYWYICDVMCKNYVLMCNRIEKSLTGYTYTYAPVSESIYDSLLTVPMNPKFTLDDNLCYYSNRLLTPFVLIAPMDTIDISTIYGKSTMFTAANLSDKEVRVVAVRK